MNIQLKSNCEEKILKIFNIECLEDNSAYKMNLEVYSRGFSASKELFIEPFQFNKFIEEIKKMNDNLNGTAKMKPMYEDDYIEFICDKSGHLNVKGQIFEFSDTPQYLKFEFVTDQTCLPDFINDLNKCITGAANEASPRRCCINVVHKEK